MNVQVTRLKRIANPKGKIVAKASVRIDNAIDLNDISVVDGQNGLFVGFPYREYEKDGQKKKAYYVWISDEELRVSIQNKVLAEYAG